MRYHLIFRPITTATLLVSPTVLLMVAPACAQDGDIAPSAALVVFLLAMLAAFLPTTLVVFLPATLVVFPPTATPWWW